MVGSSLQLFRVWYQGLCHNGSQVVRLLRRLLLGGHEPDFGLAAFLGVVLGESDRATQRPWGRRSALFGDSNEFYLSVVERMEFPRPLWLGNILDLFDPRSIRVLTDRRRVDPLLHRSSGMEGLPCIPNTTSDKFVDEGPAAKEPPNARIQPAGHVWFAR